MKRLRNGNLIPFWTKCKSCGRLFESPEDFDMNLAICEECLRKGERTHHGKSTTS